MHLLRRSCRIEGRNGPRGSSSSNNNSSSSSSNNSSSISSTSSNNIVGGDNSNDDNNNGDDPNTTDYKKEVEEEVVYKAEIAIYKARLSKAVKYALPTLPAIKKAALAAIYARRKALRAVTSVPILLVATLAAVIANRFLKLCFNLAIKAKPSYALLPSGMPEFYRSDTGATLSNNSLKLARRLRRTAQYTTQNMDHFHHLGMDHGGMGHGGGNMGNMCNMHMTFTWDTQNLCVVFRGWRITSTVSLVFSLVAIIAIVAGYEALREGIRRFEVAMKRRAETVPRQKRNAAARRAHMTKSLLYGIQNFYAFMIMLIFMTYNGWVMVAVSVGAALGYLLFGSSASLVSKESGCPADGGPEDGAYSDGVLPDPLTTGHA
ncbi:hypothetical protein P8C59_007574 [Phyllachora maydis]|uniref:Copper transport protein n=1 Tax=Phyllachora maydis TaxID=1825666 RepID=A0AAD9I9T7_9PEZI|nr:hypothetical protein P8C59_007574 [Phyllachora maydis]